MNRRAALLGLSSGLAFPGLAAAQGPARRRVGVLLASTNDAFVIGLRKALVAEGYVDGRNLELVIRDGKGQPALIEQAARELVAARVEVIVAWATGAAQAAGRVTRTIPIVAQVADAVGAGIVGSLARPEGNITGISSLSFDFAAKRVELLLEALPRARVLGFVGLRGEPNQMRFFEIARRATPPGVEQRMIEVDSVDGFEAAVAAVRDQIDGLTMQQIFYPESARIGAILQRLRVPTCGADRAFTEAGGLMAFDAYLEQGYERMASYVDQLLAGVALSKLPFEQLSRTYLVLNLRAAAELGIAVPPILLARANEIIE